MGIFTNKCGNPECRRRVRKGSKFCPKCGSKSLSGLTHCGRCQAEVSTASKFCWRCGVEMSTVEPAALTSDRWARMPADFAVRFDNANVHGALVKPLVIEHGTRAMFFQNGRYRGELEEGRYDVGGFLDRIQTFLIDQRASVVILDAGDISIDLENGGLWTRDPYEIGTTERLVLRTADPEAFFVNFFKGRNRVSIHDLEVELAGEVQMLLSGIIAGHRAADLFSTLGTREEIERALRGALSVTLSRFGLELVQLRFVDFVGEAFEKLRRQQSALSQESVEVDQTTERAELQQRLRQVLTQEKMNEFKAPADLEEFIRQTEHEMRLHRQARGLEYAEAHVIGTNEIKQLKDRFAFDRNRESVLRRIEIQGIEDDVRREREWEDLLSEERQADEAQQRRLERDLHQTANLAEQEKIRLELRRLESAEDQREAQEGLGLLRQTADLDYLRDTREVEVEGNRLAERNKATVTSLLSILGDPNVASQRITELETLRLQQGMTPEQLLAVVAAASPAAAQAMAAKYQADGLASDRVLEQLRRQIAEQRGMAERDADRMERVLRTSLREMGDVAETRARAVDPRQTVVVPAMSAPVVVTPQEVSVIVCVACSGSLSPGDEYCPNCGKPVKAR